ncbi:unnamed protein product [Didymodactylos carnosus]|uniref:SH3 domain-binding protein 5-like protein n=1 Tax=Didymodactylos carnosus TaxID=1234261 RepID=A0A813PLZ5_9BILA|nr:unnamed protein product [Didymodactylos carnosus]CAF0808294.1 unnamed protein product [Didymodactylos carnosus]CAF3536370.1 unnamed protein product [Didymodactylos carnosus]CAF3592048.1 unnamed protein product [Didymodactylos carnosus]
MSLSSEEKIENEDNEEDLENQDNNQIAQQQNHDEEDDNKEPLDPRIQDELERANAAMSEVNNLETQFDEAQQLFQTMFSNCKQRLAVLSKKLGRCVEKARPYYEACKQVEEAQLETQKAAQEFQRSFGVYQVAKETLSLAESKLLTDDKREFDAVWQEYVNHATMKVMQAEHDKTRSERLHQEKSKLYQAAEERHMMLYRTLRQSILKSKLYFDAKAKADYDLQTQKLQIEAVQKAIYHAKRMYRAALNNLERISEEIHLKRKNRVLDLPPREPGVGSENPDEEETFHPIKLPELESSPNTVTSELTEFPKIDLSDDSDDNLSTASNPTFSHSISSTLSISPSLIELLTLSNNSSNFENDKTPVHASNSPAHHHLHTFHRTQTKQNSFDSVTVPSPSTTTTNYESFNDCIQLSASPKLSPKSLIEFKNGQYVLKQSSSTGKKASRTPSENDSSINLEPQQLQCHLRTQSAAIDRVSGEGKADMTSFIEYSTQSKRKSSLKDNRQRKHGLSSTQSLRKLNGRMYSQSQNNETPLLSNLMLRHNYNNNDHLQHIKHNSDSDLKIKQ